MFDSQKTWTRSLKNGCTLANDTHIGSKISYNRLLCITDQVIAGGLKITKIIIMCPISFYYSMSQT